MYRKSGYTPDLGMEHLNPGGWFEVQTRCPPPSDDDTVPEDSVYLTLIEIDCKGPQEAGTRSTSSAEVRTKASQLNFPRYQSGLDNVPQNTYPKNKYFEVA